jgi:hypothetical protein
MNSCLIDLAKLNSITSNLRCSGISFQSRSDAGRRGRYHARTFYLYNTVVLVFSISLVSPFADFSNDRYGTCRRIVQFAHDLRSNAFNRCPPFRGLYLGSPRIVQDVVEGLCLRVRQRLSLLRSGEQFFKVFLLCHLPLKANLLSLARGLTVVTKCDDIVGVTEKRTKVLKLAWR